ncbi:MAG TPA: hypothetical protein VHL98_16625 [Microvirga sp.]|jgi:hypothetical protein|nr:hypothetical protein [Microvirga sp.]
MSTLDKVRAIIRAEVERANPLEEARGPLELIVESAVRYAETDGQLTITVLDEAGQPKADRTIADVIADFRAQHPTLFKAAAPADAPAAVQAAPEGPAEPASAGPVMPRASQILPATASQGSSPAATGAPEAPAPAASRDWLLVTDRPAAPSDPAPDRAGGSTAPAAARTAVAERLEGGLDAARANLARAAGRLGSGPQAIAVRFGRMGQALRASVSAARATLQDFGDRPAAPADGGPTAAAAGPVPRAPRVEDGSSRATRAALIAAGVTPWYRRRHVIAAGAGVLALVLGGALLYSLLPFEERSEPPSAAVASTPPVTTEPARRRPTTPPEPVDTGSLPVNPPAPLPEGSLRGVPEVIDTATLSIGGKVAPLFGVQWTRGAGEPADLAGYLRGREVVCVPADGSAKAFRCEVEGQDLSKVVLFNGGGRATSDASPDLLAAEAHARSSKTGLWAKANP